MTDTLIFQFAANLNTMLNLASSAGTKLYYAMLQIANCVSKIGHLQLALVVGSKTKSADVFSVLFDYI